MIDWIGVGISTLCIVGLSIVLAAISFVNAEAAQRRVSIRLVLQGRSSYRWIYWGLVLFCSGMMGEATTLVESVLWFVLASLFGVQAWQAKSEKNCE